MLTQATSSRLEALVPDAELRSAVAGLRGLGRSGLSVGAMSTDRRGAGLWSRYTRARLTGPNSGDDPEGFRRQVAAVAAARGSLVVYPSREETIDALMGGPMPPEVILPLPPADILESLRDKRRLEVLAGKAGLRTPAIVAEGKPADLRDVSAPHPVVLKPVRAGNSLATARVVETGDALRSLLDGLDGEDQLLVQERVAGDLLSLGLVISRDGRVAARFMERASQVWPPDAGSIRSSLSVAPDEELVAAATRLLAGAGFWGLAQIDFLVGSEGPTLLDINPRFYLGLPLALACGANLPATWHAVVTGDTLRAPAPYRVGVRYRWLEADVMAALRGNPAGLLATAPGRRAGAMWARDDPGPSAILTARALSSRVSRRVSALSA